MKNEIYPSNLNSLNKIPTVYSFKKFALSLKMIFQKERNLKHAITIACFFAVISTYGQQYGWSKYSSFPEGGSIVDISCTYPPTVDWLFAIKLLFLTLRVTYYICFFFSWFGLLGLVDCSIPNFLTLQSFNDKSE